MVRNVIHFINPYDPGRFPEDLGISESKIISLSSNENPLLPPDDVKEAYIRAFDRINRYPHPFYDDLKELISEYVDVEKDMIAVGNGASEILKMICEVNLEAFDKVIIPMPGYTMYIVFSMLMDASIRLVEFPEYKVDAGKIEDGKLIFLCSPNNPTGNSIPEREVRRILESFSGLVVIDEAYAEFSKKSFLRLVDEFENLIVVRSFSKFFSMAGARVGYAVGNYETISAIEKVRLPFNISYISVAVAKACLDNLDYFIKVRDEIVREREWLYRELKKFDSLKVYPSDANFILVRFDDLSDSQEVSRYFESKGIILRDVTGLIGLDGVHYRITVGRREDNLKFLSALEKFLG
ncbi:histidinol phosphate aminotransferase apoenzyme [Archaeoglobus sulfaticallidus PM70-1]|uniref:Histidinol-phosphate aminotransferase n=1 Tax=Archaeoglobus sulfaticallidus PM70-1 TaxID=387631 RepID=N0BB55_9EURY|nr:histidinol-phosphate transaminase [Archaeoglobus sulfaticallidus]AGK60233.1 histidinol phosphate aminotransferase apoenzyme [Archaeoglobus sulfaticallidus PM70-1]